MERKFQVLKFTSNAIKRRGIGKKFNEVKSSEILEWKLRNKISLLFAVVETNVYSWSKWPHTNQTSPRVSGRCYVNMYSVCWVSCNFCQLVWYSVSSFFFFRVATTLNCKHCTSSSKEKLLLCWVILKTLLNKRCWKMASHNCVFSLVDRRRMMFCCRTWSLSLMTSRIGSWEELSLIVLLVLLPMLDGRVLWCSDHC